MLNPVEALSKYPPILSIISDTFSSAFPRSVAYQNDTQTTSTMSGATRPKLRTKTGCLTCRQRRKKCNEKFPVCDACSLSSRNCQWPSSSDLLDRRYASHSDSRHREPIAKPKPEHITTPIEDGQVWEGPVQEIQHDAVPVAFHGDSEGMHPLDLVLEAGAVHGVISHDLELLLSRHFADRYFSLLLLPSCHRGFHDGWLIDIQHLMVTHKSLYYSVLACSAAHYMNDESWYRQDLALMYYSKALKELSTLLATVSSHENHNGLLMSVMLLYLHGCLGWGTTNDIPRHVSAATRIVTLRLLNRPDSTPRLFDRLAIESVVYQTFLVSTGLWSDSSELSYDFNPDFWDGAEKLLERSTLFPGSQRALNSPVLGVPASLFRLVMLLRQCYRVGFSLGPTTLEQLRNEVASWEERLPYEEDLRSRFNETAKLTPQETCFRDGSYLYATLASLLLEQILQGQVSAGLPLAVPKDTWQIQMAVQVLKSHQNDQVWTKCYLGDWPIYSLGLFMSSTEHKQLVRSELQRRWECTKTAMVTRFERDLEAIWAARDGTEVVCSPGSQHNYSRS
ncbi:Zn(2)-C6 fungal-type domain-containing protein [Fusarium sp. Ph1]|nr:Zn(2)-C6 fungal-type domain-containing protein [Fusarium sp. Ph1]